MTEALSIRSRSPSELGFPDIRHFVYKAKAPAQFMASRHVRPYTIPELERRLHETYLGLQNRIDSQTRPVKLIYHEGDTENVLGWVNKVK